MVDPINQIDIGNVAERILVKIHAGTGRCIPAESAGDVKLSHSLLFFKISAVRRYPMVAFQEEDVLEWEVGMNKDEVVEGGNGT